MKFIRPFKKEMRPICSVALKREKPGVVPVTGPSPTSASIFLGRAGDRRCDDDPSCPGCGAGGLPVGAT